MGLGEIPLRPIVLRKGRVRGLEGAPSKDGRRNGEELRESCMYFVFFFYFLVIIQRRIVTSKAGAIGGATDVGEFRDE